MAQRRTLIYLLRGGLCFPATLPAVVFDIKLRYFNPISVNPAFKEEASNSVEALLFQWLGNGSIFMLCLVEAIYSLAELESSLL